MLRLLGMFLMLAFAVFARPALAEYPDKLITLVVPVPPGGAGDLVARNVAAKLSDVLNQRIVVDNRGGAAGTIAATAVARSAPDGYTLLLSSSTTHGTAPVIYKNLQYDAIKDFTHIGLIASVPAVLSVNADLPIKSVAELVKYANSKPGELNFGSSGIGSPLQLWAEMFMVASGAKFTHVPYKGAGPAMIDLLAGRIHMMFDGLPSQMSGIKGNRLRPLAAMSAERSPFLEDVPTMAEVGYPSVVGGLWFGLSGPAKLSPDAVTKLKAAMSRIVAMEDFQAALKTGGVLTIPLVGDAYTQFIKDENAKYDRVAKSANISVE